jgi:hypothetical protein
LEWSSARLPASSVPLVAPSGCSACSWSPGRQTVREAALITSCNTRLTQLVNISHFTKTDELTISITQSNAEIVTPLDPPPPCMKSISAYPAWLVHALEVARCEVRTATARRQGLQVLEVFVSQGLWLPDKKAVWNLITTTRFHFEKKLMYSPS